VDLRTPITQELFVSDAVAKAHVSSVLSEPALLDRLHEVIHAHETGLVQAGDQPALP
jgi:hypothetical protein